MSTRFVIFPASLMCLASICNAADVPDISFTEHPGRLEIRVGGNEFATYVYRDEKILRPYFANVHAPNGMQVTRNHPPRPGDPDDHAEMHPGIWLGFGDISGADFWRNKARVEHVKFTEEPVVREGRLTFAVHNRYGIESRGVCFEVCRYAVIVRPAGILLTIDSDMRSDKAFAFGDQEEMGLGIRVASPLRVKGGNGRILASDGKKNESQVRGSTPDWVDYGGIVDGQRVGMMLIPDNRNFRKCWFHARDYGLLVANPFGENALTGGPKSAVNVPGGQMFRLRFGVLIHSSPADKPVDLKAAYKDYVVQTRN